MAAEPSPSAADELLTWAEARFDKLSEAEKRLLRAAPQGEFAWCGPSRNDKDPNNDPSKADAWGPERSIRAKLVRWLCVDQDAKTRVDPKGLRVYAARIDGPLDLSFVTVPFPLIFKRCRLTHDADLKNVDIPALDLSGSWVRRIWADGATVKGDVFLGDGFRAEGKVRLVGAQIEGALDCCDGIFKNPSKGAVVDSGEALNADRIRVMGTVFLCDRFSADGEVRMVGAQIGGDFNCSGGTFKNPSVEKVANSGTALNADSISVAGSVFLRNGFVAEGGVRLVGAQIGGDLECRGGIFSELNAQRATIKDLFFWSKVRNGRLAKLDLRNAAVGSIEDDDSSWPDQRNLDIDGFVYGRISGGPIDSEKRLEWIKLQRKFTTQPYRQLAKVLSESGDEDGARYVLYRMEDRRQKEDRSYFLGWFLRVTVGHGYYPMRSLWGLGLLSGLGWFIYRRAHLARAMAPTDEQAYRHFRTNDVPPPHYKRFFPFFYSLENSLPLVQLGQAERWQPDPDPPPPSPMIRPGSWTKKLFRSNKSRQLRKRYVWSRALARRLWRPFRSERFLRIFLWVQIILGWVLATLFAAGVSGILLRD